VADGLRIVGGAEAEETVEVEGVVEVGAVAEAVKAEASVEVMAARAADRQAIEGPAVSACDW
jgi:hypothetical protein